MTSETEECRCYFTAHKPPGPTGITRLIITCHNPNKIFQSLLETVSCAKQGDSIKRPGRTFGVLRSSGGASLDLVSFVSPLEQWHFSDKGNRIFLNDNKKGPCTT